MLQLFVVFFFSEHSETSFFSPEIFSVTLASSFHLTEGCQGGGSWGAWGGGAAVPMLCLLRSENILNRLPRQVGLQSLDCQREWQRNLNQVVVSRCLWHGYCRLISWALVLKGWFPSHDGRRCFAQSCWDGAWKRRLGRTSSTCRFLKPDLKELGMT